MSLRSITFDYVQDKLREGSWVLASFFAYALLRLRMTAAELYHRECIFI